MPTKPMRLPPVKVLRVKNPNRTTTNPCVTLMSSVLACWASTGFASATCSGVEQSLRTCMDGPQAPKPRRNNINYHLSRFQKYLEGPSSKKK
ncbi:40S ribosomal protein mrp10 [Gnomoniopsis sp. IMI 355080]|nr:40S ribosomal protein mrp10 [Gnomoniopsis sp. IMI 355080]